MTQSKNFNTLIYGKIQNITISTDLNVPEIRTELEARGYNFNLEDVICQYFKNELNSPVPLENPKFLAILDPASLSEKDQQIEQIIRDQPAGNKMSKYLFKIQMTDTKQIFLYDYYAIYLDYFIHSRDDTTTYEIRALEDIPEDI